MLKCVMIDIMKAQECRLNLCFQLNVPQALAGKVVVSESGASGDASLQEMMEQVFDSEEERIFQRIAKQYYNSVLEILESKLRRHAAFRASVVVDPHWLVLAKKYNEVLVNRLRGVVLTGRVDLVYGLPVKIPISRDKTEVLELARQVKQNQEFFWQTLGTKCRVVCLDGLEYDDYLAGLLEKMGFEALLVKSSGILHRQENVNEVYLPDSCDKMLAIVQNDDLLQLLVQRSRFETIGGEILQVDDFYKKMFAECLKGSVITLVVDAEVLQVDAEVQDGIAMFIRELIEKWRENSNNSFVSVVKICEADLPVSELVTKDFYDSFSAENIMRKIQRVIEENAAEVKAEKDVEKKQRTEEGMASVKPQLRIATKKETTRRVVKEPEDTAELVDVKITKKVAMPVAKLAADNEVKVMVGHPKVKKEKQARQIVAKPAVKKELQAEVPSTPRPVKAPGFALKIKLIDKMQQEVMLREKDIVVVATDDGGEKLEKRTTLDFDDLWTFDAKTAEEEVIIGKKRLPSIGSGNIAFRGLRDSEADQGDIEQFDYNSVEPQRVVRQIKFTAINNGDFGEVYEFSTKK